jgi:hypothetical protein
MVHAEVLVVEFVGHCAIGQTGNEVDVMGDGGGFVGEDFDLQFTDLVDMNVINLDIDSTGRGFSIVLFVWDAPWNKVNFEVGSLGFNGVQNDLVDGITAMVHRGHLTENTGSGNMEGGRKAMSVKEAVLVIEPGKEGGVLLELPERGCGTDPDEEMDDGGVAALPGHHRVLDTTYILVDGVAHGDVTFHGKNTIGGCFFDREDNIVGVRSLQNREKVHEEHLDGKCRGVGGGTVNVNTEECDKNHGGIGARDEKVGKGVERSVREHGRRVTVTIGDAIVVDVHGSDRRVGIRRNQYVVSVESNPAS